MAIGLRPGVQPEAWPEAMDSGEEQGGDSGSRAGPRPHRGFLLSGPGHDDAEWEPPSEAELKVIQARRERQDKISKLMSEYLLKGYRMLGECCDECGTILLQDKQKKLYCVTCQELNSDVDKDNPALNAQAALSQLWSLYESIQEFKSLFQDMSSSLHSEGSLAAENGFSDEEEDFDLDPLSPDGARESTPPHQQLRFLQPQNSRDQWLKDSFHIAI